MKMVQIVVVPMEEVQPDTRVVAIYGLGSDGGVYRAMGLKWVREVEPPALTRFEQEQEQKKRVAAPPISPIPIQKATPASPIYTPPRRG